MLRAVRQFDVTGRPDRIVANSRYIAEYLEAVYGSRVSDVVYPGVTVEDFSPGTAPNGLVLAVGQLWRHKRVRLIIEAMHHVDDAQLLVVGAGPEKDNLRSIAERIGVADRVSFQSNLTNRDVQELFARCLCNVFVPTREPFGIVALETLAAGKPLIAVNEGGFTEIVDNTCAFLVPPEPLAIADRIRRLNSDRALADDMGRRGRELARKYSWDRTAEELLSIIEECHTTWKVRAGDGGIAENNGTLVGCHYFAWYREGYGSVHWNDTASHGAISDSPRIGYYDSTDGETLRYHLKLIRDANLDFICFNLHVNDSGLDPYELRSATVMCQLARAMGLDLRFAINLCLYTQEQRAIERALETTRREFLTGDYALKIKNKPVLFLFWTGALSNDDQLIRKVVALSPDTLRIALSPQGGDPVTEARKAAPYVDGYCPFSPLEVGPTKRWEALWQDAYDVGAVMSGNCRILTISPGYDDTPLQDPKRERNPFRQVERNEGETYRRMMDFAARQEIRPDVILISTFNEFHENTHIEPTNKYGDLYLRMTADFARSLK